MTRLPRPFRSLLESLTKTKTITAFGIISGDFLFCIDNGMLRVLNKIASIGDSNENTVKGIEKNIPTMHLDLAL